MSLRPRFVPEEEPRGGLPCVRGPRYTPFFFSNFNNTPATSPKTLPDRLKLLALFSIDKATLNRVSLTPKNLKFINTNSKVTKCIIIAKRGRILRDAPAAEGL